MEDNDLVRCLRRLNKVVVGGGDDKISGDGELFAVVSFSSVSSRNDSVVSSIGPGVNLDETGLIRIDGLGTYLFDGMEDAGVVGGLALVLMSSTAAIAKSAITKCEFSLSSGLHSQLICTPCMRSNILDTEKISSLRDMFVDDMIDAVSEAEKRPLLSIWLIFISWSFSVILGIFVLFWLFLLRKSVEITFVVVGVVVSGLGLFVSPVVFVCC